MSVTPTYDRVQTKSLLLSVPDAAVLLGVCEQTVWKWVYERRIGSVKLGRSRKIKRSELERFIEDNTTPARQED